MTHAYQKSCAHVTDPEFCFRDPESAAARHRGTAGAAAARNVGLEASRAEWCMLLDDDVEPAPDLLYRYADAAHAAGGDAATPLGLRPLVLYVAVADNLIDAGAYRPDDVVEAVDGQTIEIVHTDAEGRMVLADALALASV